MRVINKKVIVIPIFLLIIFVLLISFKIELKSKNSKLDEVKLVNSNIDKKEFAIMIESETGEYVLNDTNEWPNNMIYNEDLSGCMDNKGKKVENAINYNGEINKFYLKTNSTLSCYLYFDIPIEDKEFTYAGECEEYKVRGTGYYQIEAWGASGGGTNAGLGGYTSGVTKLIKGETLYLCVGGKGGENSTVTNIGGFNGGGYSGIYSDVNSYGGGGATDIRLVSGSWDSEEGLNSRIMVAAGGAGTTSTLTTKAGSGGGLFGENGTTSRSDYNSSTYLPIGGVQKSRSYAWEESRKGGFGYAAQTNISAWGGGGGSGYYGGGMGYGTTGSGGSSFISGYAGVNAITSSSDRTHTNNTLHYSNKYFINTLMIPGEHSGDGKAKISFISSSKPIRNNTKLNNVRYIKDCTTGNSSADDKSWEEIQAIFNGVNVAKGKSVTGTGAIYNGSAYGGGTGSWSYDAVTDGDIDNSNASDAYTTDSGNQCITIDLGENYDLDEIAVWHYWNQNWTYYDNYTYVSSDNENWIKVIDKQEPETSEGKRVNAYEGISLTIKQKTGGTVTCTNNTTNETSTTSIIVSKGDSITCTMDMNSDYTSRSLKIGNDVVTSGTSFTYDYDLSKTIIPTYYKYCTETTVTGTEVGSCSAYCGGGTQSVTEYLGDKYDTSHDCGSRTTKPACNTQSCTGCYMVSIYDNYTLNCRSGKGTEYSMVTYFSPNQYLMFTYDSSGWYYNSTYGCYSHSDYLYYVGQSCP